jgi:hypothetical protein
LTGDENPIVVIGQRRHPQILPIHFDLGNMNACSLPYTNFSYGFSATGTFPAGAINGGVNITFSRPIINTSWNIFKGWQLSLNFQGAAMGGVGLFYGAGEQYGAGISRGPAETGSTTSVYAEGDIGDGAAAGLSLQGTRSSLSGALSGKVGVGVGAFAGIGEAKTFTLATPPLGC